MVSGILENRGGVSGNGVESKDDFWYFPFFNFVGKNYERLTIEVAPRIYIVLQSCARIISAGQAESLEGRPTNKFLEATTIRETK